MKTGKKYKIVKRWHWDYMLGEHDGADYIENIVIEDNYGHKFVQMDRWVDKIRIEEFEHEAIEVDVDTFEPIKHSSNIPDDELFEPPMG